MFIHEHPRASTSIHEHPFLTAYALLTVWFTWEFYRRYHYFIINLVLLSIIHAFSYGIHRCSIKCENLYLKHHSY